jgi:DMSO/TMAO reductase YedYZ molybdopterin-dependent catalytic subunit
MKSRDLIKAALKEMPRASRRQFLRNTLSLGGLAMLTGCNVIDEDRAEEVLRHVSRFNDRFQALLFNPRDLAPTYPESMITRPFPFNAFYEEGKQPEIDGHSYRLEVSGLVAERRSWTLRELHALPQISQITRHICVEGWSAIGSWAGVPLRIFLQRIGADLSARYIGFKCADGYYQSIDMATALHAQSIMALAYDGRTLPSQYGYPMKIRMPTKLGYKNPKHVVALFVTNTNPGGYWEDQGYNWFGGS